MWSSPEGETMANPKIKILSAEVSSNGDRLMVRLSSRATIILLTEHITAFYLDAAALCKLLENAPGGQRS
jgi:hypothetical protein